MVDKKSQESTETETNSSSSDTEIPIGEDYKLFANKKLGSGAFGEIYQGVCLKTNEDIAIKLEMSKNNKHPQLLYEYKLYNALNGGCKFFKDFLIFNIIILLNIFITQNNFLIKIKFFIYILKNISRCSFC